VRRSFSPTRDQVKLDAAMADVKAMLTTLNGARNPAQ
jgi:hypothetical protein